MSRRKALTDDQHHQAVLDHLRSEETRERSPWAERVIRWHDHEPAGPAVMTIRDAARYGSAGGHGLLLTPYWVDACLWAALLDGFYIMEELLRGAVPHPDALAGDHRMWRFGTMNTSSNGFAAAVQARPNVRNAFAERFRGGLPHGGYPRPQYIGHLAALALFVSRDGSRAAIARHPDVKDRDVLDIGMAMIGWTLES